MTKTKIACIIIIAFLLVLTGLVRFILNLSVATQKANINKVAKFILVLLFITILKQVPSIAEWVDQFESALFLAGYIFFDED